MVPSEEMPTEKAQLKIEKAARTESPSEHARMYVEMEPIGSAGVSVPSKYTSRMLQGVIGGGALVMAPGVTLALAPGTTPDPILIVVVITFQIIAIFLLVRFLRSTN
jgi:hypothetical protein